MSKLWYKEKANIWEEALPIGNGRMGAMIYGGVYTDEIQLNEESIWYGSKVDRLNPDALAALPKIRELIFEEKIPEAEKLMKLCLSGCPESMHSYQSLGNIYFEFENIGNVKSYVRSLDLDNAVYEQYFSDEDTTYYKKIFASHPSDVIVINIKASGEKKLNFSAHMRREKYFDGVRKINNSTISLYGNLGKGGFDFDLVLMASSKGGMVKTIGENIVVSDASEATLYFCADSTYHVMNASLDELEQNIYARVKRASERTLENLYKEHVEDYKALYDRVEFHVDSKTDYNALPTDERLKKISKDKDPDEGLFKLYFDYGRYLLISCSRKGTLPATLQGLWNKDMAAAWESKYTININTQMNYWPSEVTNLSECHEPLFELIKKMVINGRKTASLMYGAKGWVAHHNTDIWGDTNPQDIWIPGTYWVMGGAFLCTHIWTHYQYTLDKEFLTEFFPIMRECAEFFLDYLVEKDGYLVTCPSVSPENTYRLPNGITGCNSYAVTMDNQILRDLFEECILSAKELNIDDELNSRIKKAKEKLPPTRISSNGTIMEWIKDYEEVEIGHRHISHLYGLYPSNQISFEKTPELMEAASKTLERRLSNGGGHTGWSRAWIINHYARLRKGNKVYENFKALLETSTYPNMFDKHPPFQIDGNFGATAAIAEMLVQSDEDVIVLLPALFKELKSGYIKGLKIKGAGNIDIFFKNTELIKCVIKFNKEVKRTIIYKDIKQDFVFPAGKEVGIELGMFKRKLRESKD